MNHQSPNQMMRGGVPTPAGLANEQPPYRDESPRLLSGGPSQDLISKAAFGQTMSSQGNQNYHTRQQTFYNPMMAHAAGQAHLNGAANGADK